jgi:hypothetical protein
MHALLAVRIPVTGALLVSCAAALCLCTAGLAQEPRPVIGVFDLRATGGQGANVDGLIRGLTAMGYQVQRLDDLTPLALAPCDIVYLSDMHNPGNVSAGWRDAVEAYVRAGGSILQTWHHHILSPVSIGVRRVYGSRRMHVVTGEPAVEGLSDFDALFEDHIVEQVGPLGKPLLKNDAGDVVATAGIMGAGRVISTGLALAIPGGSATAQPRGAELELLRCFLRWLTSQTPASERVRSLLPQPVLALAPPHALAAAGMSANFMVRVAARAEERVALSAPEDVSLAAGEPTELPGGILVRRWTATVTAAEGRDEKRELPFEAGVGERRLEAKAQLEGVYGTPAPNERRGVWLHVGEDRRPQDVMPELNRLGLNMVVLRIAGGAGAFYASRVQSDILDPLAPDGDWLADACKYARENGIELHPYVNNCIVEGRTTPATIAKLRAAGRLQEGPKGEPIDWYCPSQEINCEAIEKPMVEIATRYDVAGVQYDFIRYPNDRGCFCAKCRTRFEQETGKPVANWPADVITGDRHPEWVEYRCSRISAIVQRVSTAIRKAAPGVKVSAAVFPEWPQCRESVGQDWVRWCKEGWLDFVCPMNYTPDPAEHCRLTTVHRAALPPGFPLVEGIGINSGQGRIDAPEVLAAQIALDRKQGVTGFLGFCYTPQLTTALFEPLTRWLSQR